MRIVMGVLVAATAAIVALACADGGAAGGAPSSSGTMPQRTGGVCQYHPSPLIVDTVGAAATVGADSDCGPPTSRRYARLLNGPDGITGFDATCGVYSGIKGSAIKVYRCAAGVDTLVIYTDTTGTTELQRIPVVQDTLP